MAMTTSATASATKRKLQRQTKKLAMITTECAAVHGVHAARVARRQGEGWFSWEEARRELGVSTGHMTTLLAKGSAAGGLDAYRCPRDKRVKLIARADVERLLRGPGEVAPATDAAG